MFLFYPRRFKAFAFTGTAWFLLFVAYSWSHFRRLLPSYYMISLDLSDFPASISGNLFSPGRGLVIYVPFLIFTAYLILRFRKLAPRRLFRLAGFIIIGNLIVLGRWSIWWGGSSYGPRLTAGLVPWLVLLNIIGLRAMIEYRQAKTKPSRLMNWSVPLLLSEMLLVLSVCLNAPGAMSRATWVDWNGWMQAVPVSNRSERVWDWRYPQFMAGLFSPPSSN